MSVGGSCLSLLPPIFMSWSVSMLPSGLFLLIIIVSLPSPMTGAQSTIFFIVGFCRVSASIPPKLFAMRMVTFFSFMV